MLHHGHDRRFAADVADPRPHASAATPGGDARVADREWDMEIPAVRRAARGHAMPEPASEAKVVI
jgi:hypothetical protein